MGNWLKRMLSEPALTGVSHLPSPGAGCRVESYMDYQKFLSRGHGQRQPPTLCHHPGKPRQVSTPLLPATQGHARNRPLGPGHMPGEAQEHCWPPRSPAQLTPASFPTRVKRLGCFDHAQRQLGERCLYVFPAKVEPAKIAWECPEKNCAQGEGSMAKKVCPWGWGLVGI